MKKDTHPQYYKNAKISCSCGASFSIGSTTKDVKIEVCSQCHPHYTGKKKILDSMGRVEKFKQRMAKKTK